ncbi:STAS domain-containing protein [Gordonia sp. LSe1-13]|uniref:Anti-sigma factor antagonist n=1 Tax=Gordonia sesuvii TaxID=3116777 RepID=A0ABU7MIG8_9ACTN|nr:STAS domain-containing protein [Gordonia sp. LSe1-13]
MNLTTQTTFQPSHDETTGRSKVSDNSLTATKSFCVQRFSGEIDMQTAPDFAAALDRVLTQGPECVVLDLSGVGFVGASGLSILARFASDAAAQHMPVAVVCRRSVARPIEACQLDEMVSLHTSVDEAGSALAGHRLAS